MRLVESKQDILSNFEKIAIAKDILDCLACGVEITMKGYIFSMQEGKIYIKVWRSDSNKPEKGEEEEYMRFGNQTTLDNFIQWCYEEFTVNKETLTQYKFEKAAIVVLNNIDKRGSKR